MWLIRAPLRSSICTSGEYPCNAAAVSAVPCSQAKFTSAPLPMSICITSAVRSNVLLDGRSCPVIGLFPQPSTAETSGLPKSRSTRLTSAPLSSRNWTCSSSSSCAACPSGECLASGWLIFAPLSSRIRMMSLPRALASTVPSSPPMMLVVRPSFDQ